MVRRVEARRPGCPRFDTRVTRLLGIDYPIIQGAMAWLSKAELVGAVSNAGGLGVLGASQYSLEEFGELVLRTKALTDRPFAVNFPLALGNFEAHLELALREGVRIVFVSAGSARAMTKRIHDEGGTCVHVVPNLRLAEKAVEAGVDAVVLESYEAGGHISAEGFTGMTNIPAVTQKLEIPVIAAGGIVDGRGMAAALALGADGIQMGTRFLATRESNAAAVFKDLIVNARQGDVSVYGAQQHPARALRTPAVQKVLELERSGASPEEIRAFIGRGRARKAADGDLEDGLFFSGAGADLIEDQPSVAELFERILGEYEHTLERLRVLMGSNLLSMTGTG